MKADQPNEEDEPLVADAEMPEELELEEGRPVALPESEQPTITAHTPDPPKQAGESAE